MGEVVRGCRPKPTHQIRSPGARGAAPRLLHASRGSAVCGGGWGAEPTKIATRSSEMRSTKAGGTITAVVNALAKAGVDLGENGSVKPKGRR